MVLFGDILSTQEAKFQIWYLSEFLVVLWPKYVTLNKTNLGIHKKGQTKNFCKNPHWIVCANLINLQKKNDKQTVFEVYLILTMPLNHVVLHSWHMHILCLQHTYTTYHQFVCYFLVIPIMFSYYEMLNQRS